METGHRDGPFSLLPVGHHVDRCPLPHVSATMVFYMGQLRSKPSESTDTHERTYVGLVRWLSQ